MSFLENINFKKVRPLLLPVLALFLIINANIEKDNNLNSKYWPTSWKDFKKSKEHNPNSKERKYEAWRQRVSVIFSNDLGSACKKSLNIANLIDQYTGEINVKKLEIYNKWGVQHWYPMLFVPPEEVRKKRIELVKKYGSEQEVRSMWANDIDALENRTRKIVKTINRANQEFVASSVDVLRIAGYEDWQLYSRWNEAGIADLLYYYREQHDKTRGKESFVNFEKWLVKEGIFSKEETNNGAYNPYWGTSRITPELRTLCRPWGDLKNTPSSYAIEKIVGKNEYFGF